MSKILSVTPVKKYKKFIGPSQMAIALGIDDFQSPEDLKKEIEEGYVPKDTYATTYGKCNESIALYYYKKLYKVNISSAKFIVDPVNPRIGGICDGLINDDTGIEIKCHVSEKNLLKKLPLKFKIQMAAYMYLYKRKKWVLMSCIFNTDDTLSKYSIFELNWDQVKDQWEKDWYPEIVRYINTISWKA